MCVLRRQRALGTAWCLGDGRRTSAGAEAAFCSLGGPKVGAGSTRATQKIRIDVLWP